MYNVFRVHVVESEEDLVDYKGGVTLSEVLHLHYAFVKFSSFQQLRYDVVVVVIF